MQKKVAYLGVFAAAAMLFGYLETLIPIPIGVPGVKLGLANLIVVLALYKMDAKSAFAVSFVRVMVSGFLFGNMFSIWYSLAGAMLSLAVMVLLYKTKKFSVWGVSMAGGVAHNIGQLIVAMLVLRTANVWYYIPVLLAAGVLTGMLIGIVSDQMLKRLNGIDMHR